MVRRARHGHVATAVIMAFTAFVLGLQAPAAAAAPRQATLADVFSSLSISAQPTDYIAIVDTSASMVDQGRYQLVKAGLTRMAQALRPDDRVAVITFDTGPVLRRPLSTVGADPTAIASSLPGTPNGQGTDIGSAIASALTLMEGAPLRTRVAVMLFTDGQIDTPATSPYATVNSRGWAGLHQRAEKLQQSHDIAPLAVALTSNTDAAVLKKVFSNVIDVPATNLGNYLSQVSTTVMKAAAIKKLQPGLTSPVTATIAGLSSAPSSQPTDVTITLHNGDPFVPVQVTGLAVSSDPRSAVSATGLPDSVDIAGGGTASIAVKLTDSLAPGAHTSYHVTGSVTSGWQSVITQDLGMRWTPALTSSAISVQRPSSQSSTPADPTTTASASSHGWLAPAAGAAGLIAVAVALAFAARGVLRSTRPPLIGTVTLLREGAVVDERLLRGRSMTMTFPPPNPTVRIVLQSARDTAKGTGVKVHASTGKERSSAILFEGDAASFGDITITYTSDRTRMLKLIGTD